MGNSFMAAPRKGSGSPITKRRLTLGAVATLTAAGLGMPATPATAAGSYDNVTGYAEASILAAGDKVCAAWSEANSSTNPGPNRADPGVATCTVGTFDLDGREIPLGDAVDFGEAGVWDSESTATTPFNTHAISGLVGSDGRVTLDELEGDFKPATIDLLKLLGQDTEGDLIDAALLEVGLGGAEVQTVNGNFLDPDGVGGPGRYRLGKLDLSLHSPAIDMVSTRLYDAVGQFDTVTEETVNKVLDVSNVTGIQVQVESSMQEQVFGSLLDQEITTKNEILSVNLATGDFRIRLDKILAGERPEPEAQHPDGLNDQDPNTELVDDQLYPMVAETIHDLMDEVWTIAMREVEGALGGVTLRFTSTAPGATATWSMNLKGEVTQVPTCTSTTPLGSLQCAVLVATARLTTPVLRTAIKPVYHLLISDAGAQVFKLAVGDLKTRSITQPVRQILDPFLETFTKAFSIRLNSQRRAFCWVNGVPTRMRDLRLSAVSVALAGTTSPARIDLGNARGRTRC